MISQAVKLLIKLNLLLTLFSTAACNLRRNLYNTCNYENREKSAFDDTLLLKKLRLNIANIPDRCFYMQNPGLGARMHLPAGFMLLQNNYSPINYAF